MTLLLQRKRLPTPTTVEDKGAEKYEIEVMGVLHPATREPKAVFDPKNARIKGDYGSSSVAAGVA